MCAVMGVQGFLFLIHTNSDVVHKEVFAVQSAVWFTEQRATYGYGLMSKAAQLVETPNSSPGLARDYSRSYEYIQLLADAEAFMFVAATAFPNDATASSDLVRGVRCCPGASGQPLGVRVDAGPVVAAVVVDASRLNFVPVLLLPVRFQRDLFMVNGCIGASNVTECEGIVNGLFRKGLHSAVQYLLLDFTKLIAARQSGYLYNMTVPQRMATPLWKELEVVGYYAVEGLITANIFRDNAVTALGSRYQQLMNGAQVWVLQSRVALLCAHHSSTQRGVPVLCRRFWCWASCSRWCSCSGPRSRS